MMRKRALRAIPMTMKKFKKAINASLAKDIQHSSTTTKYIPLIVLPTKTRIKYYYFLFAHFKFITNYLLSKF